MITSNERDSCIQIASVFSRAHMLGSPFGTAEEEEKEEEEEEEERRRRKIFSYMQIDVGRMYVCE